MQEAADYIGSQFQVLQNIFLENKILVPPFGEAIDRDVQLYIAGLEQWVIGNLHWSFDSQRYFGRNHESIKRTLSVPICDTEKSEEGVNSDGKYHASIHRKTCATHLYFPATVLAAPA